MGADRHARRSVTRVLGSNRWVRVMLRALYAGLALPTGTIREPRRVRPMRSNAEDGAP